MCDLKPEAHLKASAVDEKWRILREKKVQFAAQFHSCCPAEDGILRHPQLEQLQQWNSCNSGVWEFPSLSWRRWERNLRPDLLRIKPKKNLLLIFVRMLMAENLQQL